MQSLRKTSPTTLIFMSISIVLIESFQSIEAFTPDFTPPAATYKTSVPSINKSMSLRQQCHTIRRRNYSKSSNDWITGVGVVPLAVTSNSDLDTTVEEIRLENEILKNKVQQLIVENEKLHLSLSETPATTAASQKLKIVLEQFEGESFYNDQEAKMALLTTAATEEGDLLAALATIFIVTATTIYCIFHCCKINAVDVTKGSEEPGRSVVSTTQKDFSALLAESIKQMDIERTVLLLKDLTK
mmetsp:Transcript_13985/g.16089  ORF Transcript_13985/g.16089 Transcript_13985/m.16089 type:complete len:243 (+) Transcript_13985:317-1045(+)